MEEERFEPQQSASHHHHHKKRRKEKDRVYDEPDLGFVPEPKRSRHFSRHSRSIDERDKREEVVLFRENKFKQYRRHNDEGRIKVIIV